MINGVINIYKEKGFTSHDVVAKLRGIVHQKKIGHTGTLDPDAVGVLPVCFGNATKLCDLLTDHDKEYRAVIKLGIKTDTLDMSGEVISTKDVCISEQELIDCIKTFEGEIMQIPPMYSALKVNGQKLCDLARKGVTVEREARKVTIYSIDIESVDLTNAEATFTVKCSKGTYIRTLCDDIGDKLGCGACMKELTRTKVERFEIAGAVKLSEVQEYVANNNIAQVLIPTSEMFDCPKINLTAEFDKYVHNGNMLPLAVVDGSYNVGEELRIYDSLGKFCGLYKRTGDEYSPVKMFLEAD